MLTRIREWYDKRPLMIAGTTFTLLASTRIVGAFEADLLVASIGLTPLVLLLVPRSRWARVGMRPASVSQCAAGTALVLIAYSVTAVACVLAFGTGSGNWFTWIPRIFEAGVPGGRWLVVAAMVIALGVAVPVLEEVCYRGVLHDAVGQRLGPTGAVVLTAAAWTSVHLGDYGLHPFDGRVIAGMVPSVFLMGVALGLCRVRTGSVVTCIVGQGFANLVLLVWVLRL
jgi:uncharacterized protein